MKDEDNTEKKKNEMRGGRGRVSRNEERVLRAVGKGRMCRTYGA